MLNISSVLQKKKNPHEKVTKNTTVEQDKIVPKSCSRKAFFGL